MVDIEMKVFLPEEALNASIDRVLEKRATEASLSGVFDGGSVESDENPSVIDGGHP